MDSKVKTNNLEMHPNEITDNDMTKDDDNS